jgi:RNA polymerase sigma-70 factor (ECF subfamily)
MLQRRAERFGRIFSTFLGQAHPSGVLSMMAPEDLGRLVDEHASALVLYARQWCAVAEDVVQEAFVKLFAQGRSPDNPVAWLYRVVRNAAISSARAEQRRSRHQNRKAEQSPGWFIDSASAGLDAEAAAAALRTLPLEQREVIVAHLWGGLTFAEIAGMVGCSSSTAHRWYLAGLSTLRERLGVPCPKKHSTPV